MGIEICRFAVLPIISSDVQYSLVECATDHSGDVLEVLEYEILERLRLERVEREIREGRRNVTKSVFEQHIVRQTDNGVTFEATVNHLREAQHAVTRLVFALTGCLAQEVSETVSFIRLVSLEAIDAERITILVKYLENYSKSLVMVQLSEDVAPLEDEYRKVTVI